MQARAAPAAAAAAGPPDGRDPHVLAFPSRLAALRLAPKDERIRIWRPASTLILRCEATAEPRRTRVRQQSVQNQMAPTRQFRKALIVQTDQRFLLASRPALDLLFADDGIEHAVVGFSEHKRHRPSLPSVASVIRQIVVLPYAGLHRLLGQARIVGAIGASNDVNGRFQFTPSLALRGSSSPSSASHLRMRGRGRVRQSPISELQLLCHRIIWFGVSMGSARKEPHPHPEVRGDSRASKDEGAAKENR